MSAQDEFFKKAKSDPMEIPTGAAQSGSVPRKELTAVHLIAACCVIAIGIYLYEKHQQNAERNRQMMRDSERIMQESERAFNETMGIRR